MKKILWTVAVVSTLLFTNVSASFMYVEIEPVCSITGETYTSQSAWKSDTSSWSIPTAYEGECLDTVELSDDSKKRIYEISSDFFKKYSNENRSNADWISLNTTGQKIVNERLFPKIQTLISDEMKKENPHMKTVAVLNYFAKTIWYDYFVTMPYSG